MNRQGGARFRNWNAAGPSDESGPRTAGSLDRVAEHRGASVMKGKTTFRGLYVVHLSPPNPNGTPAACGCPDAVLTVVLEESRHVPDQAICSRCRYVVTVENAKNPSTEATENDRTSALK